MNIWEWINEYQVNAQISGDERQTDMVYLFQDALSQWELDPGNALGLLERGRALAEELHEERWVLLFDHWRIRVKMLGQRDFRDVLGPAAEASRRAAQPQHINFPQRICLHEDLIRAYQEIDPLGHRDDIETALAYMRREVSPDMDCRHCIWSCQIDLDIACDRWKEAYHGSQEALEKLDQTAFGPRAVFKAIAYEKLCRIAFHNRTFRLLKQYADQGYEAAERAERKALMGELLVWQAIVAVHEGQADRAARLCNEGVTLIRQLLQHPSDAFFDALCGYFVEAGQPRKALKVRNRELKALRRKGRHDYECRVRIERCRLMAQLGLLGGKNLEKARRAARRMKQPERYLKAIDEIAALKNKSREEK